MLTLQEYNIVQAKKALNNDTMYKIYSECYYRHIDIRTCNIKDLSKTDRTKVIEAQKNIENLKQIANGEKLDPIYELYYYGLYVKNFNNEEE